MNLALFDLDNTLLPLDSDYEWGQFLCRTGVVDPIAFTARNDAFYTQYVNGTLDPIEYLEFALGTLSRFPRSQLDAWHGQFMDEVIRPALRSEALALVDEHRRAGDAHDHRSPRAEPEGGGGRGGARSGHLPILPRSVASAQARKPPA